MVNQLSSNDNITVTLQWLQEAGAVYNVNALPEISQIEHTSMSHSIFAIIYLTISYNIQYNVSIVSSLCGVTTTKVLNYGKYGILNIIIMCYTTTVLNVAHFHVLNEFGKSCHGINTKQAW